VSRKVNLIAATGGIRSAQSAKGRDPRRSRSFSFPAPTRSSLVSSPAINRAGRQPLTGVNLDTTHLISKRLELLHEFCAGRHQDRGAREPGTLHAQSTRQDFIATRKMISRAGPGTENELETAFKTAVEQDARRALLVAADPLYFNRAVTSLPSLAAR